MRVTTVHTFTFGTVSSVFEDGLGGRDAGFRPGALELVDLRLGGGEAIEPEEVVAMLAARREHITVDALIDLLSQEAENEALASLAA